jgi:hypothetical protein
MSEDWLIANLPEGWWYDCTFNTKDGPAFLIYASDAPDATPFVIPLKLLKDPKDI